MTKPKRIAGLVFVCCAVYGQSDWRYSANSPKPLLQAIRDLRTRYGWSISYENGPYVDKKVVGPPERGSVLEPVSKSVQFDVPISRESLKEAAPNARIQALQRIIDQHNAVDPSNSFVLRKNDSTMAIVPAIWKGKTGYRSLLDEPVYLQPVINYRNLADAIGAVLTQVAANRHESVNVGMMPWNIVLKVKPKFDVAAGTPAHDAVVELLAQVNSERLSSFSLHFYTWELLYDPITKGYFFNIASVPSGLQDSSVTEQKKAFELPTAGDGGRFVCPK